MKFELPQSPNNCGVDSSSDTSLGRAMLLLGGAMVALTPISLIASLLSFFLPPVFNFFFQFKIWTGIVFLVSAPGGNSVLSAGAIIAAVGLLTISLSSSFETRPIVANACQPLRFQFSPLSIGIALFLAALFVFVLTQRGSGRQFAATIVGFPVLVIAFMMWQRPASKRGIVMLAGHVLLAVGLTALWAILFWIVTNEDNSITNWVSDLPQKLASTIETAAIVASAMTAFLGGLLLRTGDETYSQLLRFVLQGPPTQTSD